MEYVESCGQRARPVAAGWTVDFDDIVVAFRLGLLGDYCDVVSRGGRTYEPGGY